MNELEFNDEQMDELLKRQLQGPVPSLSTTFDEQLLERMEQRTLPQPSVLKILLWGYPLVSILISVFSMRSVGLTWDLIFGSNTLACLIGLVVMRASKSGNRRLQPSTKV